MAKRVLVEAACSRTRRRFLIEAQEENGFVALLENKPYRDFPALLPPQPEPACAAEVPLLPPVRSQLPVSSSRAVTDPGSVSANPMAQFFAREKRRSQAVIERARSAADMPPILRKLEPYSMRNLAWTCPCCGTGRGSHGHAGWICEACGILHCAGTAADGTLNGQCGQCHRCPRDLKTCPTFPHA